MSTSYLHIVTERTAIVTLSKSIPAYVLLAMETKTWIASATSCTDDTDMMALRITMATGSSRVRPATTRDTDRREGITLTVVEN